MFESGSTGDFGLVSRLLLSEHSKNLKNEIINKESRHQLSDSGWGAEQLSVLMQLICSS